MANTKGFISRSSSSLSLMCLRMYFSPHLEVNGVLRYYKLCWNVLNSNVSCTEAEGIPSTWMALSGVRIQPRLTERMCTARVSPWGSEKPEVLKNSRVVRARITGAGSWGTQYGYLIPIPIPPNASIPSWRGVGRCWGNSEVLLGRWGWGSGWLRDLE